MASFVGRLLSALGRRSAPSIEFSSARLAYRQLRAEEIPDLCQRITLACLADMSPDGTDLRDPIAFAKRQRNSYVVILNGEIIGFFGLYLPDLSFGFWIAPEHRGRGYAGEVVGSFMKHAAFDPLLRKVGCWEDNFACRRIIEGNGFTSFRRLKLQSRFCDSPRVAIFFRRTR